MVTPTPRILSFIGVALLAAASLSGCSADDPTPSRPEVLPDTYLQLSVRTAETPVPASSRAYPEGQNPNGYDYGFEEPESTNEKIRTMRFLIIDQSGHIEHNVFISESEAADTTSTKRAYRVKANETKQIYLVGNESSLDYTYQTRLKSLNYGDPFPTDYDLDYTISSKDDATLFGSDAPIPMTEFHEVTVGKPKYDDKGEPIPYSADLFVTRVATKFSVILNLNSKLYSEDDLKGASVSVNPIAQSEYLFPKGVEYLPEKKNGGVQNRIITSYEVPQTGGDTYTFAGWSKPYQTTITLAENTEISCLTKNTVNRVYLPETQSTMISALDQTQQFKVAVTLQGNTFTSVLPDLPSLPRNTHVRINITFNFGYKFEVDVLPYQAVPLNPQFGFDTPLPRPIEIGKVPPWLDINPDEGYEDQITTP